MPKVLLSKDGAGVHMVDDSGSPIVIAKEDVQRAVQAGYQFEGADVVRQRETAELRSGYGQQAIAAGEAALRGATVGLSDAALGAALGDEYSQGALERQQYNPITATVGEIGGAVAPLLLSGGSSAVARGVSAIGTPTRGVAALGRAAEGVGTALARGVGITGQSLLGRVAQRGLALGASGAVEGSLYGAGKAISDAALHNDDLTAEKLLAGITSGTKSGFFLGAGAGAGGAVISAGARKISEKLTPFLQGESRAQALSAAGFKGSDLRKAVGRKSIEAGEEKLAQVADDLLNYTWKTGPKKGEQLFRATQRTDDLFADIAAAKSEIGDELGAVRERIFAEAPPQTGMNVVESAAKRIRDEVIDPLRKSEVGQIRKLADETEEGLQGLFERATDPARPEVTLAELKQIQQDIRKIFQPDKPASGGLPPAVTPRDAHLEKAERIISDEIEKAADAIADSLPGTNGAQYAELRRQYNSFRILEDVSGKTARQEMGNRTFSPSDYATGIGTGLGAMLSGNVAGVGIGVAGMIAHKVIRERGNSVAAVMAKKVAEFNTSMQSAAKTMAMPEIVRRTTIRSVAEEYSHREYARLAEAVAKYQQDPQAATAFVERSTNGISSAYPKVAANVQSTIDGDMRWLATQLPAAKGVSTELNSATVKGRVARVDQERLLRKANALAHPEKVIRDLERGHIDRDSVKALEIRRPKIWAELRMLVVSQVASRKSDLPYPHRVYLSKIFKFDGDWAMRPKNMALIQSTYQQQPAPRAPKPSARAAAQLANPYNIKPGVSL